MVKRYFLLSAVVLGVALGLSLALYRTQCGRATCLTPPTVVTNKCEILHSPTPATDTNSTVVVTNATPVVVTNASPLPANLNPQTTNAVKRPASRPRRTPTTYAPNIPKSRQVLLANRRIVIKEGRSFPKTFCAAQSPTVRATAPYIVISELPVSRDVRIRATADGAKVIGFLPNNALLVEADATALKNLEDDVLFMAAVEYEPMDKIQRNLLDAKPDESVEATIVLLNEADRATVQSFIADAGGKLLPAPIKGTSLSATIRASSIVDLAKKAEIKWMERYARLKVLNNVAVKPNLMNVTCIRETPLDLTGAGQIITTCDTGIDTGNAQTMHKDVANALLGFERTNTWLEEYYWGEDRDLNGHGTHTAGTLVGNGALSDGTFRGVASGAKLWAWFGGDGSAEAVIPPLAEYDEGLWYDFERMLLVSDTLDASVASISLGDVTSLSEYEAMCVAFDDIIWRHPDFLPVLAAGNEGEPFSEMTITPPATAKNVLAVGASESLRPEKGKTADNPEQIADFSSCGPCEDGRIKPDLVAPGTYIVSCRSTQAKSFPYGIYKENTNYVYNSGTSMATPLVAGSAALVREWLAKYRGMSHPSAALVKAILTGGTNGKDLPNNDFGWGRVDIGESVAPTNGLAVYMKDRLPFDAGTNFVFSVTTTNAASLRAQLVWIDYPGAPNAGAALVNNLDLSVSSVTNGVDALWYGNGGKAPDELNTVESVRIENAMPGRYIVKVSCPKIPNPHDEGGAAAIYIRGAFDPKDVAEGPSPLLYYIAQGKVL